MHFWRSETVLNLFENSRVRRGSGFQLVQNLRGPPLDFFEEFVNEGSQFASLAGERVENLLGRDDRFFGSAGGTTLGAFPGQENGEGFKGFRFDGFLFRDLVGFIPVTAGRREIGFEEQGDGAVSDLVFYRVGGAKTVFEKLHEVVRVRALGSRRCDQIIRATSTGHGHVELAEVFEGGLGLPFCMVVPEGVVGFVDFFSWQVEDPLDLTVPAFLSSDIIARRGQ